MAQFEIDEDVMKATLIRCKEWWLRDEADRIAGITNVLQLPVEVAMTLILRPSVFAGDK